MSQSLRGSTVTNYFKFSLAGTSTIVLYSFESPWASLCPCANTCCVRGVASARATPRQASKRLDCRLWKRDLFHQHNRKGKIVMIETSRYKGLVFGFVFGTWNWYDFWRRSWGLPCSRPLLPTRCFCVTLMRFYIGTAQLKKVLGVGLKPDLQGGTRFNLLRVQFWTPVQRKRI